MEYPVYSIPYERAGWRTASSATQMSTFHALYRKYDELICFGVEQAGPVRELDSQVVAPFLSAIETQMLDEGFPGDHGLSPRRVAARSLKMLKECQDERRIEPLNLDPYRLGHEPAGGEAE